MILIFGGTTEGRLAVEVCEQAGQPFYYATWGTAQRVPLRHGIRLSGDMGLDDIRRFCLEKDIRLIIDASHPFAESLHLNIAQSGMPVIRLSRKEVTCPDNVVRCRDFDDAVSRLKAHAPRCLLALTGVKTIASLQAYWQQHETFFRILDRSDSRAIASACGFPEDHLLFYDVAETPSLPSEEDERQLMQHTHADAIITKDSGQSGGLEAKINAASALGLKIFVVDAPDYVGLFPSDAILRQVTGHHTLRRAIEELAPDFFPLRTGLTTGTCATAAVVAATRHLLMGETPAAVLVHLADGETITVPVGFADGKAFCIKDFSDDPDVTRGCRIMAKVEPRTEGGASIRFLQGEGVGRVTLPGLGIPVGEPAINPVPRQMITDAVQSLTDQSLDITISVENGRELAERTFNSRVGVVDGISIIGTSGIVSPLSNEAFVDSIRRELQVARAIGCDSIGLASGKKGEEALLSQEPSLRVIHYGNFIGAALAQAHELGFRRVVLGIMLGKAVKLAEGHLDTHSHKVLMNKTFLAEVAKRAGVADADDVLQGITMARELWALMPPAFFDSIHDYCLHHARTVFPDGELDIRIIQHE